MSGGGHRGDGTFIRGSREGYRDTDDPSVFIRFKVKDAAKIPGGEAKVPTSFVAWTTTPWTLSSNVALAVREDFTYALVEHQDGEAVERFVLAQDLIEKTFAGLPIDVKKDLRIVSTFPGSALLGMAYEPVLAYLDPEGGRAWEVDSADFVTLDQGTGIVHIAPAFGEDDYRFAKGRGLASCKW